MPHGFSIHKGTMIYRMCGALKHCKHIFLFPKLIHQYDKTHYLLEVASTIWINYHHSRIYLLGNGVNDFKIHEHALKSQNHARKMLQKR